MATSLHQTSAGGISRVIVKPAGDVTRRTYGELARGIRPLQRHADGAHTCVRMQSTRHSPASIILYGAEYRSALANGNSECVSMTQYRTWAELPQLSVHNA